MCFQAETDTAGLWLCCLSEVPRVTQIKVPEFADGRGQPAYPRHSAQCVLSSFVSSGTGHISSVAQKSG
ncbi:hypothetical protein SKAU_G00363810 [Synaphobranchus kaupii]|uniref:Uncharacterized protein n=1 Tax=Synaphobranchus kaupii TaxID=118154 RepID=A0A9Q1EIX7_SYNKA|nr:hypothetical protein SKAU_G00363810 [Synaphobranchus kaupii]